MTKWAVLGAGGMLGQELGRLLQDTDCKLLNREDCDVTNSSQIQKALYGIDVVVNCAAWTAVDDAESHESQAYAINSTAAANVANACSIYGTQLIHISTDYVFDGDSPFPYAESAETNPKSAYGRTKLAGELAIRKVYPERSFIVRTAWLYGEHGKNFVKTMMALALKNENINVVDDQFGQPTWTRDLSKKIVELIDKSAPSGVYHGTSSGRTSWYGFANKIFEIVGADQSKINRVTSNEFTRPAPRPANSTLSHENWRLAGIEPIQDWENALEEAFRSGAFSNA